MRNIALIDDRDSLRRTTRRRIMRFLPSTWGCIDTKPFHSIRQYTSWITENDVYGLILDQRLDEEVGEEEIAVDYKGNQLAKEIRKSHPDIPIYSITSYESDEEIQNDFDAFEHIFDRTEFRKNTRKTLNIIFRGCIRYHEKHLNDLNRIGELCQKATTTELNESEKSELHALQEYLSLDEGISRDASMSGLVAKIEADVERLEKILGGLEGSAENEMENN